MRRQRLGQAGGPTVTFFYFGSADHFVYAVNAADGKEKWKRELGGAVLAGPNVAKGIACVGTTDTKI